VGNGFGKEQRHVPISQVAPLILPISQIRRDGGTQSRVTLDEATVAEYAEAMGDPDTVFPPVTVYHDGRDHWLADGFHRIAAWERIGRTDIPADILKGDRRRAILHSLVANTTHGLRRSNEDKRRAVTMLLKDEEWSLWSQSKIAKACRVSREYVNRISRELSASSDRSQDATRMVERGHTTYPQDTTNIGKRNTAKSPATSETSVSNEKNAPAGFVAADPAEPSDRAEHASTYMRRDLSKLTTDALIDEVIGLRAALADASAKIDEQRAEIDLLKTQLMAALGTDGGKIIGHLTERLKHEEAAKWRSTKEQGRLQKQVAALKKRVDELQAMGIPL
jgi:hypothetical protein